MATTEDLSSGEIFLALPELIESLLPFLDTGTTLSLCKAYKPTIEVLKGAAVWDKLIRRTCAFIKNLDDSWDLGIIESRRTEMGHLTKILKMMENPLPLMIDLLDVISQVFLPYKPPPGQVLYRGGIFDEYVQLSCPRHQASHVVSPEGFLLLEQVEEVMGLTLQQKVEKVAVYCNWDPLRGSLSAQPLVPECSASRRG